MTKLLYKLPADHSGSTLLDILAGTILEFTQWENVLDSHGIYIIIGGSLN